ncbi:MAG: type I-U CRISPR-associated protein Csb2 [Coriobacteriales bacterium]|nr:type I-U CRISPR-associated protein Csb2 [Coriobacteriales bacterium]
MPLEVRADYLFGCYQGHSQAGELEDVPSVERLHKALFSGACSLERLERKRPDKKLDPLDQKLFSWLEENAPDAIYLPKAIAQESSAIAYRNKNEIEKGVDGRKKGCPASSRSFLSGPVAWYWDAEPENDILERLKDVSQEVPYLGESDSRVLLSANKVDQVPADALRRCAPMFDVRSFKAASPGYTRELETFFAQRQKVMKKDKTKENEQECSLQFNFTCLQDVYYENPPEAKDDSDIPWLHGYALKITDKHVNQEQYVALCVSLHRTLVSKFGDALPKILQRAGIMPLANGFAIQIISSSVPQNCLSDDGPGDFLIAMLPKGTPAADEAQVVRALSQITRLYSRSLGSISVVFTGEQIDLGKFWSPVPKGSRRLFSTEPLFIPDSRPPASDRKNGGRWTADDDARIAFGHTWRDYLPAVKAKGDKGRIELTHLVEKAGVAVRGGRIVPIGNIRSYVHHTNRGSFLVGEQAMIDMSSLGRDRCLCAIGQTRHLGGGLLVPIDIPSTDNEQGERRGHE